MSRAKLMLVVASAMEARSLLPVYAQVQQDYPQWHVDVFSVGKVGVATAEAALQARGVTFGVLGRDTAPSMAQAVQGYDLVLVGNDVMVPNIWLLEACAAQGIPSVLLQEGATSSSAQSLVRYGIGELWRKLQHVRHQVPLYLHNRQGKVLWQRALATLSNQPVQMRGYGFSQRDYFLVASEAVAADYRAQAAPECIAVTGIPNYIPSPPPSLPPLAERSKIVILSAPYDTLGWWSAAEQQAFFQHIVSAIYQQQPQAQVVLKIHPQSETLAKYQALQQHFPQLELCQHHPGGLSGLLAQSQLAITVFSTAALEALAHGVPVLFTLWPSFLTHSANTLLRQAPDLGFACYHQADMAKTIRQACQDRQAVEEKLAFFREDYRYCLDGLAAVRISRYLGSLL